MIEIDADSGDNIMVLAEDLCQKLVEKEVQAQEALGSVNDDLSALRISYQFPDWVDHPDKVRSFIALQEAGVSDGAAQKRGAVSAALYTSTALAGGAIGMAIIGLLVPGGATPDFWQHLYQDLNKSALAMEVGTLTTLLALAGTEIGVHLKRGISINRWIRAGKISGGSVKLDYDRQLALQARIEEATAVWNTGGEYREAIAKREKQKIALEALVGQFNEERQNLKIAYARSEQIGQTSYILPKNWLEMPLANLVKLLEAQRTSTLTQRRETDLAEIEGHSIPISRVAASTLAPNADEALILPPRSVEQEQSLQAGAGGSSPPGTASPG